MSLAPNPLIARVPPHSEEAERNVIAACFTEHGGFDALNTLPPSDAFYVLWHRRVWESMRALRSRSIPIEVLSLKNDLERRGEPLTDSQEHDLLVLASETVVSSGSVVYYARMVKALWSKRRLIEEGAKIVELGWSPESTAEVFAKAQEGLASVTEQRTSGKIVDGESLAVELYEHMQRGEGSLGVKSGWLPLDSVVKSFRPGEMSVLAARPSMGKTSLALSISSSMLEAGHRVGIVSLEMERLQLACNAVGAQAGIDTTVVRAGQFPSRSMTQAVLGGVDWLSQHGERLAVFDGVLESVSDLEGVLRRMVQRQGVQIAWVDYMQLLSGSRSTRGQGRYAEITEVSMCLKRFARKLGVHVCALAQLNRKVEDRKDKTPCMADLRDSGQVEQDADLIMLLTRPEYYWPDNEDLHGLATLDVAKNRNGPTGKINLCFEKHLTRFNPL